MLTHAELCLRRTDWDGRNLKISLLNNPVFARAGE
jgi:hypothetical protein